MPNIAEKITKNIDGERLKNNIIKLVSVPSPPGREGPAAGVYASFLEEAGMDVELDCEFPDSPSVIGRLKGITPESVTLQFDGHLDTIAAPGPEIRFEGGYIYGRGTEDMKGDLCAVAEAVSVIRESGVKLPGNILVTAHGEHESGKNHTLESLINKGVVGDAVIVAEGYTDRLPLAGLGLAIWEIRISREGEPTHENETPAGTPNPLTAGMMLMDKIQRLSEKFNTVNVKYIGSESIFTGKFQCGDYFNRFPVNCVISGSRRFGPDKCLSDVKTELQEISSEVADQTGTDIKVNINGGLESFEVTEDESIVKIVRKSHKAVFGSPIPFCGMRTAGNLSNFVKSAGIPGVYYGINLKTAHSDNERILLDEAVKVTKVFVHAILNQGMLKNVSGSVL